MVRSRTRSTRRSARARRAFGGARLPNGPSRSLLERCDERKHARVHGWRSRDDVTRPEPRVLVTLPVGHDATRLAHDDPSCRNVPGREVLLEIAVEHPGGGPREIEARRTRASEVFELSECAFEDGEVLVEPFALGTERKAGRAARALGGAVAHMDRDVVAERSTA